MWEDSVRNTCIMILDSIYVGNMYGKKHGVKGFTAVFTTALDLNKSSCAHVVHKQATVGHSEKSSEGSQELRAALYVGCMCFAFSTAVLKSVCHV